MCDKVLQEFEVVVVEFGSFYAKMRRREVVLVSV